MTFETFLEEIKNLTETKIPKDISIHYRSVQKNNGVVYTGIYLDNCDRIIASPLVYMEPFFDAFEDGKNLEQISDMISDILLRPMPKDILKTVEEDRHFPVSDVVIRLVNAKDNDAYLKNAAHYSYLDMAATFGILIRPDESTDGTIMVTPEIMKDFQIDEEELFSCALMNTEKMLGEELMDLEYYLKTMTMKMPEPGEVPVGSNRVYILTNRNKRYGAAAMIYSKKMRVLSEVLKMDLYILPCSVHEVLLIPKSHDCKDELKKMVMSVNTEEVNPEEVLTNSVYEYSRETGTISIVA